MSWQLFAAVQVAVFALGAAAAFLLRNRQLKQRLRAMEAESAEAAQTLAEAESRFETLAEEACESWLESRISALQDDEPATRLQRLVLENERLPDPAFSERAAELLAAGGEASDFYGEKWQALREASHHTAAHLIQGYPRSEAVIRQLYQAFSPMDELFDISLPPLPEAPEPDPADEMDLGQEAEHLRAANELLHNQLEEARAQLEGQQEQHADYAAQEADLKKLLQQFTRDSRDMLRCIQQLEQENAELRALISEDLPEAANLAQSGSPHPDGGGSASSTTHHAA